ncbi:HD domain-containing protein [Acidaminobacter sp. JC074]|nr:HD domain-containing protein [Acidaminobacter sp. JC074]
MGTYINTYTKRKFWPLDPRKEEIVLEDISHALSMICRGNGHYSHFYSVGQHSINCAYEARARGHSKRIQLACLLHDASEAYLSDITRPVKKHLTDYQRIEKNLQEMIYEAFGLEDLSDSDYEKVKRIDDAMLSYEMNLLLNIPDLNDLELKLDYDLSFRRMEDVKKEFIVLTNKLSVK